MGCGWCELSFGTTTFKSNIYLRTLLVTSLLLCYVIVSLANVRHQLVVGCQFSDKNIYPETFAGNPDSQDSVYSTKFGIYEPHCGLDNVMLSWGHDEVHHFYVVY